MHVFATLKNNYAPHCYQRIKDILLLLSHRVFKVVKGALSLLDRRAAPSSSYAVMSQTYVVMLARLLLFVVFSIKLVASICFSFRNNAHLRHLVIIKRNCDKKTIPAGVNSRTSH
jgi:hypothetical protein